MEWGVPIPDSLHIDTELDPDQDALEEATAGVQEVTEDFQAVSGDHDGQGRLASPTLEADAGSRILQKGNVGLVLLLEAHCYAEEMNLDPWGFAVEIECLRSAGLTNSDIRWLVCKELVEHAHEVTTIEDAKRRFRRIASLTLTKSCCFILTATGVSFVRRLCTSAPNREAAASPSAAEYDAWLTENSHAEESRTRHFPKWDSVRRELRMGGQVVKHFRVPAPNQERVLAAFEEESWPPRIDDPLPPEPELDPKRRLHATINSLNGRQKKRRIRFVGDGTGEGICWEEVAPSWEAEDGGKLRLPKVATEY